MIKGYCCSNLDDAQRLTFPTEFVAISRIGDWIQDIGDWIQDIREHCPRRFKVVGITHIFKDGKPLIEIELNK